MPNLHYVESPFLLIPGQNVDEKSNNKSISRYRLTFTGPCKSNKTVISYSIWPPGVFFDYGMHHAVKAKILSLIIIERHYSYDIPQQWLFISPFRYGHLEFKFFVTFTSLIMYQSVLVQHDDVLTWRGDICIPFNDIHPTSL